MEIPADAVIRNELDGTSPLVLTLGVEAGAALSDLFTRAGWRYAAVIGFASPAELATFEAPAEAESLVAVIADAEGARIAAPAVLRWGAATGRPVQIFSTAPLSILQWVEQADAVMDAAASTVQ